MKVQTIRLSNAQADAVDTIARVEGKTVSDVVREAIDAMVKAGVRR